MAKNKHDPVRIGEWTIRYDPPPIPVRDIDYVGVHDDFDGAPMHSESNDCPDRRCVRGSSVKDVLEQIRELDSEVDQWKDVRVTVTEVLHVPVGTEILERENGVRLPTGEVLKPWITYELQPEDEGKDDHRDLNSNELHELGVDADLEVVRTVEEL